MRTSLSDIKAIEEYLNGTLPIQDRLLFEARLLLSKELRKNVALQREVYRLLAHHHHLKIKEEFQRTHKRLVSDTTNADFLNELRTIFNL
jgi:hypothetical protein